MVNPNNPQEQWRLLVEEGKIAENRRRLARLYALLPSEARCRMCNMPFTGFSGQIMHIFGRGPSVLNPHMCSACDTFIRTNPGGMEIRLSMFFADIRGSTGLAEYMKPAEYRKLIDRFFATATHILTESDAIIDKLAGDQVSGYFIPGLVGTDHARVAVEAARELMQATGKGDPQGPWIPVGIGVHTGNAFFGSVGLQGGIVDVTALGDAVNVAARLASNASAGEILVSQETFTEAKLDQNGVEHRELALKGRSQPVSVLVI